jgi:hypothetical protein
VSRPADAPVVVTAREDQRLRATLASRRPMRYADGADAEADRPAHVRAASGLAWVGERLALVQDDANFIAVVDPATGLARAIALPRGPGGRRQFDDGRGNKAHKLDLEAVACIAGPDGPLLLAMGSGSSDQRERVVIVRGIAADAPVVEVRSAPAFYAALRATARFAGSELNVEGVQHVDGRLRLFGRGNGEARGGAQPVDATCDVDFAAFLAHLADPASAPPVPTLVTGYELGAIAGVRLGFTDAASIDDGRPARRMLYTAAAEDSPDATRDGEVTGSAIGVIVEGRDGTEARWTALREPDGARCAAKVEGIALVPGARDRVLVTLDPDDPDRPSELCEVTLAGPWHDD